MQCSTSAYLCVPHCGLSIFGGLGDIEFGGRDEPTSTWRPPGLFHFDQLRTNGTLLARADAQNLYVT